MCAMKLPTTYNVVFKQRQDGITKLQLQKSTDLSDKFWWQIHSNAPGRLIRSAFINPASKQQKYEFYEYTGNLLTLEGYISKPMSFCHVTANTRIDFNDMQSIPNTLQMIYEHVEI